jgi:hypothetical protein
VGYWPAPHVHRSGGHPIAFCTGREDKFRERPQLAGRGPAPRGRPLPELLLLDKRAKVPQGVVHVPGHGGGGDPREPAAQARAGDDVGEAGPTRVQPPAAMRRRHRPR